MIRRATHDDWLRFERLGLKLHGMSVFKDIPVDKNVLFKQYMTAMQHAQMRMWVAEKGEELTGFLLGCAQEFWWCRDRYATDLAFYCEDPRDARPLLRAFEAWAWQVPRVKNVTLGVSSGMNMDRIGKLYGHLGYAQVGGLYVKERK